MKSLSARRAWIEIVEVVQNIYANESLSARRAWIEIVKVDNELADNVSLSARRAWIEITSGRRQRRRKGGRSPQGERG